MKRLCQLGISLILLATFVAPLAELFDTWDTAGLANDTEFATLVLVFAFGLILAVCVLLVQLAFLIRLCSSLLPNSPDLWPHYSRSHALTLLVPPRLTPLLI
jgi:hypothetical protein